MNHILVADNIFQSVQLAQNTLMHFGTFKILLLLRRFSKLSTHKLSLVDTYRVMAASYKDWSNCDATANDMKG